MLKDNLGLRLFALFLAILIWLQSILVSEQRSVISLPLNLISLPQNITLENIPETIPFSVRGKGMDIIRLLMAKPQVNVDGSSITPNTSVITLQDYSIDLPENINVSYLSPAESDQFSIQADVFHQKIVPVTLDFNNLYTQSRLSEYRYSLNPEKVTIFGPKSQIKEINSILTSTVDQDVLSESRIELELKIPSPDVSLSESKVLLSISGIQQVTRVFPNLALPAGYIPARAAIRVQAPAAVLDTLKAEYIIASVAPEADENGLHQVELTLPEGIQVIAITPDKVRFSQ
jgi:hypothetical protein